ncbi:hypothetical protein RDWZM_000080 [Blomia tropicalis]|uniref:Uncharacterized protein n=1 Tax=Blomia tropicalis TaxID=40697 RepID=A0A9Q0M992_BLOTA|nr:hypothetical protein RDWZM_000080 [Blomia tropicalis]
MVEVNIVDEENVTLNDNRSSNSPNINQSFNNDTILSKTTSKEKFTKSAKIPLEDEFGSIIFSIIVPCILVGGPFNFCFSKTYHNVHKLMNTKCLKIYTFCLSTLAHIILGYWIAKLSISMFTLKHLTDDVINELFILSYLLAGTVSLDIIWFHRRSIMDIFSNLLDYRPLLVENKHVPMFTENISSLKFYRYKFRALLLLSYLLAFSILVYYSFLACSIVLAYTDTNPEGYSHWRNRLIEIISIYSLFFFASDAILLLSLLWATQYKIKHLNVFIGNLIKCEEPPEITDIEIVKSWYQNVVKTVKSIDRVFSFFIVVYVGFFFLTIIYFANQTVMAFKHEPTENVQLLSMFGLTILMFTFLFYALKEFSDVHEHSSETKSILFDYVLNMKPEQRTTQFFEEINFVAQGLFNKPASFTLLGQIELDKRFMAHIGVIIYSYVVYSTNLHRIL